MCELEIYQEFKKVLALCIPDKGLWWSQLKALVTETKICIKEKFWSHVNITLKAFGCG